VWGRGAWIRTLIDTLICAVRERSDIAMRVSPLDAVLLPTAIVIGLAITWVDSRPTWDDTGITVGAILLVCTCLGGVAPQRAWRWAPAVGAWIPLHGILISHNYGSVLALAPAFLGAYAGAGVRRVIDPATGWG
jgi:prepilin signal peptidase PulO-like enzyme (type II secretory pathway)